MATGDVNKIILVGRVVREPETKLTKRGDRRMRFLVQTNEQWWDKDANEKRTKTVTHLVVVYGKTLTAIVGKCVSRGVLVYVEGQLDIRKWKSPADASESWTVEVVVSGWGGRITVLDFNDASPFPFPHEDKDEEPAPPLSIKTSVEKDTDTSGLERFLGEERA